jgi:hypothetical protein
VAQTCGLACEFRRIAYGLSQTSYNGIQGKQHRQQVECSGQVARQGMQGEFPPDRPAPTAPKAIQPLLATKLLNTGSTIASRWLKMRRA